MKSGQVNTIQKASNSFEAFLKYKSYYDRKMQVQPLKVGDHTFLLNLKYSAQAEKRQFQTFLSNGSKKIKKVLSHLNYTVRKIGTHKTHCVLCVRLHKFTLHENVQVLKWMSYSSTTVRMWSTSQKCLTFKQPS